MGICGCTAFKRNKGKSFGEWNGPGQFFFITGDCILISKEINQQQSTRDNPICRRVSVYLQWIMVSFLFKDSQKYDVYIHISYMLSGSFFCHD